MAKIEVEFPNDVVRDLDSVRVLMGFRTRDSFVIAATKRLVDKYKILLTR